MRNVATATITECSIATVRMRFKIQYRKVCRFDSDLGHHPNADRSYLKSADRMIRDNTIFRDDQKSGE